MRHLWYICLLLLLGGCSRPKEIPDRKLELIFKDIFLVNAYCNTRVIKTDSMSIYEPILQKYGYKPRDLVYTIGHFSRRKSSRLSDILEASIKQLGDEYDLYAARVAVLDTIDDIARERFSRVVYSDSLIRVKNLRDTARLRIRIPAQEGTYKISYHYRIDSTDKNNSLRAEFIIWDSLRTRLDVRSNWMQRDKRIFHETKLEAPARGRRLEIVLANYPKTATAPSLTVDSLRVVYYLPLKVALDSLTRSIIDYKLIIDGKEFRPYGAQDSLALHIDPPRALTEGDTVP